MTDFGIEAVVEDDDSSDEWKEQRDENFIETFVRYSRAMQVANEPQSVVALYGYASGLLPDYEDYLGILIRGGTSSGKSWMKENVLDAAFDYADNSYDWLYTTTGGSDKFFIDDDTFDDARIGAFNEFQQLGSELREFLKRIVEDGGYTYGRSVSDPDSETGQSSEQWTRDPLPIIFSLADENDTQVDAEMRSRMVDIQVDEGPAKNRAVHRMKHGHTDIEMPDSEHQYVREAPDLEHTVKKHIKHIPVDTDVVLPTGDNRFGGDDMDVPDDVMDVYADVWDEAEVTEPLFNFAKSESSRASAAIASMVKASALLNYHSRPTVTDETDGEEYIVAQPQDVGNVLCAREVLLATTHNLTQKKFIVLEAFKADGAPYAGEETSANAKQIDKDGVVNYIQQREDIPTFSKSQITSILDELDEDLVINKMDHPDDARKNIYVYDPSRQFERPNTHEYPEIFSDVTDPIRLQPIDTTVDEQLADLDALVSTADITDREDSDGLETYADSELSRDAELIHDGLSDVLDDTWVPANVIESDGLTPLHMIGVTPTEEEQRSLGSDEDADSTAMLVPARDVQYSDREDTIADPDHEHWGGKDVVAIDTAIDDAIHELRDAGVMDFRVDEMGNAYFTVSDI